VRKSVFESDRVKKKPERIQSLKNGMAQKWIKCSECKTEVLESYLPIHIKKAHSGDTYVSKIALRKQSLILPKSNPQTISMKSNKTGTVSSNLDSNKTTTQSSNEYQTEKAEPLNLNDFLDSFQINFCEEPSRLTRLLAPAGSGKTHSLLWRCQTLTQNAGEAENVRFLIFTFTRAARDELRSRLKNNSCFQSMASFVEVATLNAWGYRRLKSRLNNPRLVSSKQDKWFCIANWLQPVWQNHPAIKQVMTDSRRKSKAAQLIMDLIDRLKSVGFRHDKITSFAAFEKHISWMQENGMDAHLQSILQDLDDLEIIDLKKDRPSPTKQMFENFFWFWQDATAKMFEMAVLTLEDQKYWAAIDLEKAIAENRYTTGMHRFQHILVDEFQDVNPLDLALLKNIAQINKGQLCIIGDDDQAIYEWRGATPEFILNPDTHIESGYKTYILERNYRSPKNIVEISQRLIKHNRNRVDKNVQAVSKENARIEVIKQPNLENSVDYVLEQVKTLLKDKSFRNIALISRKRSQIIPYQIVFASEDIEFYAAEDLNVLMSKTFNGLKDMLLLKAQADQKTPFAPDPVESLLKLCDKVKRYELSKNDRGSLKSYLLSKRPRSLRQALEELYSYTGQLKGLNTGGTMSGSFYEAISGFLDTEDVADAIRSISDNFDGLQKDYGKSLDDIFYADPPFLYLSDYAERYGDDYGLFLEDVEKAISTLAKIPGDNEDEAQASQDESWKCRLHLMTALRAKGKEFDAVFILDCNRGIFPNKFAQTEADFEAERRLFYVALTRARKQLTLLVNDRMFGETAAPSPYLKECGL
jgi:DNA helicase-2/ATP-dependent DNA helicase PcrA